MFLEIFTCYNISVKTNEKYLEENIMFYTTGIDIANTKSMWNFLHNHFTYSTMNSWNRLESIANNVKLHRLNLDGDTAVAMHYLFDEADCGGLQVLIDDEIRDFDERHYPLYRVGFNGRSGGYLVLYNEDSYGSILPEYVTDYDSYEDFKDDVKSNWNCYNRYNMSDFNYELRKVVELVREFDRLCDRLRDIVNEYSMRSFDVDKLEDSLARFENEYYSDLKKLNLKGPELDGDKIRLNDIANYNAFMNCFFECFGDDRRRVTYNDTHVWLKEA